MILNATQFKQTCGIIKNALDTKAGSIYSESLELVTKGDKLYLNVTNREYYVRVVFDLTEEEDFRATVSAQQFLDLVNKITTERIELKITDKFLNVIGNGKYKLPLIFFKDELLELPEIELGEVTTEFEIPASHLHSIEKYNSKELQRGKDFLKTRAISSAQNQYYVDEKGCITYTIGACVNTQEYPKQFKLLLPSVVVSLFKLLHDEVKVKITQVEKESSTSTIVEFISTGIKIVANLGTLSQITNVPVGAIRKMAFQDYPYAILVDKNDLIGVIDRFLVFDQEIAYVDVSNNEMIIYDTANHLTETLILDSVFESTYLMKINLRALRLVLDTAEDLKVTVCFGDGKSISIKKGNIIDIIPELGD